MSLYRQYRPRMWAEVAGQEHIKQTLANELISGSTVQAYLFYGPRAVGKTTTARLLARALNCTKRTTGSAEPCNNCRACSAILDGATLDIIEIDAASHTQVDNVRENIIGASRVANSLLTVKIFIIDEVHMLSIASFNALLKLLEEPPPHVVFILATTELQKVPLTIASRCQRFEFKKIDAHAMKERLKHLCKLEKRNVDDEAIDHIVRSADGFQRDAETLLGQILSLPQNNITLKDAALVIPISDRAELHEFIAAIISKQSSAGLSVVARLEKRGADVGTFLNDVMDVVRQLLLISCGADTPAHLSDKERKDLHELASRTNAEQLLELSKCLMDAYAEMRYAPIDYLPIEMAVVKSCLH